MRHDWTIAISYIYIVIKLTLFSWGAKVSKFIFGSQTVFGSKKITPFEIDDFDNVLKVSEHHLRSESAVLEYLLVKGRDNDTSHSDRKLLIIIEGKGRNYYEHTKEYIEEYIEDKPLTDQQIEELDKYFEQTEKDWLKKIENLFLTKWNLDKEYLKKYKLIRKNNEQEKVDMYQKFHQEMVEKHGDNYSYNSTEEDLLMNTKIDEIYLQKIKDLLGKKHYSEYLKLKSKFNENLEKNHNPELGLIEIQI